MASLDEALRLGESHGVEFKRSLKLYREAAQTAVAFANAHGGDLFFGVAPDGTVVGVDVGDTNLERLAANLDRHIYPYAPVAISPVSAPNGKTVVQLSVVPDTPPVVGLYLYSSQPLDPSAPVRMEHLDAYRRVGRTNRRVPDPMWLRPSLPSDPRLMIDNDGATRGAGVPKQLNGMAWLAEDSGPLHGLRFRLDPAVAEPRPGVRDLPRSDGVRRVPYDFAVDPTLGVRFPPVVGVWVVAEYEDSWGCLWQSRRFLAFRYGDVEPAVRTERRIVELPPQRGTA